MKAIVTKVWVGGNNQYCKYAVLIVNDYLAYLCERWENLYKYQDHLQKTIKTQIENAGHNYVPIFFIEKDSAIDTLVEAKFLKTMKNYIIVDSDLKSEVTMEDYENSSINCSEKLFMLPNSIQVHGYSGSLFIETPDIPYNLILNTWHTKNSENRKFLP